MDEIFFIQKEGVYSRGVFWIGTDANIGIDKVNKLANADEDHWHKWILYKFIPNNKATSDANHIEIYSKYKGED